MGIEAIAILVSFTALAVVALLVGRLVATLLKILIVVLLAAFLLSRVDGVRAAICRPGAAKAPTAAAIPFRNSLARFLCD